MIYSIPIAFVLFGFLLVVPNFDQPRFETPDWRREFQNVTVSLNNSGELSKSFYEAQSRALAPAAKRAERGWTLISLGISMAVLCLALHLRTFQQLRELKTLSSPKAVCWMAILAWWSYVPAQIAWFSYTFDRGDYPWWADNIAIPIGGSFFFCLLGFPFVIWGAYASTHSVRLPVRVMQFPRTTRAVMATIVSILPLAWFVFAGIRAFWEGDVFTMPVSVGGVCATVGTWAAATAHRVA